MFTGNSHRGNMKRCTKLILEYVVRYTLLDFLTAVFLTGILYLFTEMVCTLTQVGDPYRAYAMQSIKLLGLIYIASILVTSCCGHIRLLVKFVESEGPARQSYSNILSGLSLFQVNLF